MDNAFRVEWPRVFMQMCLILRNRSVCVKYRTSAIVVKDSQIIGIGYNGTISKLEECCEHWDDYWQRNNIAIPYADWVKTDDFRKLHSEWSNLNEIHAEVNALNWVTKSLIDDTCALYTYYSPCEQCAKQILAYGIKTLYYYEVYPGKTGKGVDGLKFLAEKGITCSQISV